MSIKTISQGCNITFEGVPFKVAVTDAPGLILYKENPILTDSTRIEVKVDFEFKNQEEFYFFGNRWVMVALLKNWQKYSDAVRAIKL